MNTFNPVLTLLILVGGIGFTVLFWWSLRPNKPAAKLTCPTCAGEGRLLRQELVDAEDEGLSIERRLDYHCLYCGHVWTIHEKEEQLVKVSGFNPKMN